MSLMVAAIDGGLPYMTHYLADDLPHDTGKDDIGAVMTEVAINRLNALLDESVDDPNEQALRSMPGNMLLETTSGGCTITTMTKGRTSGWSWLSAPGWRNICKERSVLSLSAGSCSAASRP